MPGLLRFSPSGPAEDTFKMNVSLLAGKYLPREKMVVKRFPSGLVER